MADRNQKKIIRTFSRSSETGAACAVKESETDQNIAQQIMYFIVIWPFLD